MKNMSKNKKIIFVVLISLIVIGSVVYAISILNNLSFKFNKVSGDVSGGATIVYQSNEVGYDNTSSGMTSTNVQAALDELYRKTKLKNRTSNFIEAYTYDESSCVTGLESTCVETTCYKTKSANACPAGTIIKYKVNDQEVQTFHVMYDDASTITMQAQKNTIYNTAWITALDYSGSTTFGNGKGPLTILRALESATAGWSNVNDQTYTAGTTTFKTNAYTGCSADNTCSANTYTLASRTAKSRMITLQEATALGCTYLSCPKWMYNYLSSSTSNGGTVNDTSHGPNSTSNDGYWTMSAESYYTYVAWVVTPYGLDYYPGFCDSTRHGARAVIEIFK